MDLNAIGCRYSRTAYTDRVESAGCRCIRHNRTYKERKHLGNQHNRQQESPPDNASTILNGNTQQRVQWLRRHYHHGDDETGQHPKDS